MEIFPVQLIVRGFLGTLPSLISDMNFFFLLKQMFLHYALGTDTCKCHPSLFPPPAFSPVPILLFLMFFIYEQKEEIHQVS